MQSFEEIIKNYDIRSYYTIDYLSQHKTFTVELFNNPSIISNNKILLDSDNCVIIGLYYGLKKNHEEAKKYYKMGIEKDNSTSMFYLALYYYTIKKNYYQAVKCYQMAVERNNSNAMVHLAFYYQTDELDYKLAIKLYLKAVEQNNSYAMLNLGCYYLTIEKNYNLAKKYLIMAVEKNNPYAMMKLANYYFKIEKKYELSIKYNLMGINFDNSLAMINLAFYYYKIENNYELAKKYYSMGFDKYDSNEIYSFSSYVNDDFELYKFLTLLKTTNQYINEKINQLEKNVDIQIFNNKKNLFLKLNNMNTCHYCLNENVLNIILECGHEVCIDCYKPSLKCYYNFCKSKHS